MKLEKNQENRRKIKKIEEKSRKWKKNQGTGRRNKEMEEETRK